MARTVSLRPDQEAAQKQEETVKFNLASPIVSGRRLEAYRQILKINERDFRSEPILDISSGRGVAVRALRGKGYDAIGLDSIFSLPENKRDIYVVDGKRIHKKDQIGGAGELLPLKDNSVGLITNCFGSVFSTPLNYPRIEDMKRSLKVELGEMARVLKPHGQARIATLDLIPRLEIVHEALTEVARKHDISWEYFDTSRNGRSQLFPVHDLGLVLRKH